MDRKIVSAVAASPVINDGDMELFRALPTEAWESVGPFVFLDHYRHQSRRGIGDKPHPHAGIEVISYLLDGGVEHRDSQGFRDTLGPGDAQYIRAGRGMLHAEQPAGGRHGLQLWTSLPPDRKLVEPTYASFRAADIPHVKLDGAIIDVVAGDVAGAVGPMILESRTTFAVAHIDAGATIRFEVADAPELGAYVLQGALDADGTRLPKGALAVFSDGEAVVLTTPEDAGPTLVAIVGGEPARQPLYFSGPFVMDSPERLAQAERDFVSGKMGRLDGVPF